MKEIPELPIIKEESVIEIVPGETNEQSPSFPHEDINIEPTITY